jgi:chemosensory pili system protein ChpA (sensor histidine kinase/response regulator)
LCTEISVREQQLREFADHAYEVAAAELGELATTLVEVEDAVSALAAEPQVRSGQDTATSITFRQGFEVVAREVLADIARVKEAVNELSITPAARDTLAGVPDILDQVSGSLQLAGEEQAAAVAESIGRFVAQHMLDSELDDSRLELLADAVCSIEYYVEGLMEGDNRGAAALGMAGDSMEELSTLVAGVSCMPVSDMESHSGEKTAADIQAQQVDSDEAVVTGKQVIAEDADEEILSIFVEEAGEQLAVLRECVPALLDSPDDAAALTGAGRAFHTLKGSGRMLGAMAIGEFAWIFENLVNRVIEGVVPFDERLGELLGAATDALELLLEQLNGAALPSGSGIDVLAQQAVRLSEPDVAGIAPVAMPVTGQGAVEPVNNEAVAGPVVSPELPVLAADADEEIVEIFLEEAAEQAVIITEALQRNTGGTAPQLPHSERQRPHGGGNADR